MHQPDQSRGKHDRDHAHKNPDGAVDGRHEAARSEESEVTDNDHGTCGAPVIKRTQSEKRKEGGQDHLQKFCLMADSNQKLKR